MRSHSGDENYSADRFTDHDAYCLGDDLCEEDEEGNVLSEGAKNGKDTSKTTGKRVRNQQGGNKGLDEDLIEEELYSIGEDGESDDTEGKKYRDRYFNFNAERNMQNPSFKLGMGFSNATEFRDAVRNHVISL
ncbi:hypothetical protein M9H77_22819 [Catharanthus roseus]|uniref:Uncharacterized protein n=1 Tax=Catharanthus roseus TaxID=4058 RepID=A0ACC0AVK2_CATRO|nr:hypothetical protein M9H77_22819 [Catharanthus roseus]